jgi:hypothetical protein
MFENNQALENISILLSFKCPFCTGVTDSLAIEDGSGVLTILNPTGPDSISNEWAVMGIFKPEQLSGASWTPLRPPRGRLRHMAWIPKPCGEVGVSTSLRRPIRRPGHEYMVEYNMASEERTLTSISASWRQPAGEMPTTRLAGMLSTLSADLHNQRNMCPDRE